MPSFFSMGDGTIRIPYSMHKDHRLRLCKELADRDNFWILLQGGSELDKYDTDTQWDFRQESNMQWCFGVKEPGCKGAIRSSDSKALLFVPKMPMEYAAFLGPLKTPEEFRETYEVDEVHYVDDFEKVLGDLPCAWPKGVNRDSGSTWEVETGSLKVDEKLCAELWDIFNELRAVKDVTELEIMQFVNDVSTEAHVEIMRTIKPRTKEYFSEAKFKYESFLRGCSRVGYTCICPNDIRCAVLHYGHPAAPNDMDVLPGMMCLHDMGAEYHCYTADVTVSFPVDKKFTEEQEIVYNAVWAAVEAVEGSLKPGVEYKDMHYLAQRTMLQKMKDAGLFVGDIEEMMKVKLMKYFMPHGLGHQLGLDVHDVGGYAPGTGKGPVKEEIEVNLRCSRKVQKNYVLTVEPGFYFAPFLMTDVMSNEATKQFINADALERFRVVGGVRIEDNIVITEDGCRLLTKVPRTVEDIEAVMNGAPWDVEKVQARVYRANHKEESSSKRTKVVNTWH
eukprot:GEMP01028832.1.p1 GENE.GEMP01028832.1~~GEMP01028832.1.p1  ORF type:complete len:504 (+),score=116.51 GEMP01028832.1:139-1650(+)